MASEASSATHPGSITVESVDSGQPADVTSPISAHYSLSRAVQARRAEFVRPHRIRIKIGSWNVAACPGTDKDLASWFVDGEVISKKPTSSNPKRLANAELPSDGVTSATVDGQEPSDPPVRAVGGSDIGLYVLGLQEIISLNIISGYGDTSATAKWQAALEAAMPPGYTLVTAQQLSGLLLLVYASPEVAATISNVSTVSVGTGLLGYMGNKGGVSTRIVLGETTRIVFTNCHLASGHDQTNLERRYWDYNRILAQTQFTPVVHSGVEEDNGEKIGDEDFGFWFGDLNFRLDGLPGDDIRRLLLLHTRGEYDLSKGDTANSLTNEDGVIIMHNKENNKGGDDGDSDDTDTPRMVSRETSFEDQDDESIELPDPDDFVPDPHDDPASLQATLDSLLPHDQLGRSIRARKAFHEGWHEGPITFLPSYKYDIGTVGLFDSSEKQRAPSWCDRILYRTRTDVDAYKRRVEDEENVKKKDEEMKKRGIEEAADDESVLFDYDPDQDVQPGSASQAAYEYDEYDEGEDEVEGENEQLVVTREGSQDRIRLDLYTTHQRITSSDHKPIVSLFTLDYDAVVPELKAKVHAEVARELDRAENEGRPTITIVVDSKENNHSEYGNKETDVTNGTEGVDFGNIGFMRPSVTQSLTIANTGRVSATFSFVTKPGNLPGEGGENKSDNWLAVSLQHNLEDGAREEITLEPGETASALLSARVTSLLHLQALNAGTVSLEDVLVLRVNEGRDHFIPVRGSWIPSCFGRSIEELIRIPPRSGGIRGFAEKLRLNRDDNGKEWRGGSIPYSLEVHASSPSELYKLTETIEGLAVRVVADSNMLQEETAKIPRNKAGWPFVESLTSLTEAENTSSQEDHFAALIEALETDTPSNILDALPRTEMTALTQLEITTKILILFLQSLTDGIVTATLFAKIETALPALSSPASSPARTAKDIENDKSVILDILSTTPYHNISFVFVTSMLSSMASELTPLSDKELAALNSDGNKTGVLNFRRRKSSIEEGDAVDTAAIERRLSWEKKSAEVLGPAVCRAASHRDGEKDRKTSEDKMRAIVEIFLRRRDTS
ncbi:Endonuclease/exonuclease/phosphatase [Xylariales sp. PMI_506]|nr:Endonuclease/exonuclease/phosphatase [Xylariales sp. PMI_506]